MGKEKLLFMSNFSFSHGIFKIFLVQMHKSKGPFRKGLTLRVQNKPITHFYQRNMTK